MATFSNSLIRLAFSLGLVLAVAIIASGCGRKGSLERPPYSTSSVDDDKKAEGEQNKEEKQDKPFFLDPLL